MSGSFAKAVRRRRPLRIAMTGPSGAGKTESALRLARTLVGPTGTIAMIDTENGEGLLYAGEPGIGAFDHVDLRPPYLSKRYIALMNEAAETHDALVIDSMTHQWAGEGGILFRKDLADAVPGSNRWTNWNPFTEEHNLFIAKLLHYPKWLICTMRSKTEYAQEGTGKNAKIVKLGTAPITRDGTEYEFSLVFDIDTTHRAAVSKGRGSIVDKFEGARIDFRDGRWGQTILDWLDTAEEPEPTPTPQQMQELAELTKEAVWSDEERTKILSAGGKAATATKMAELIERTIAEVVKRKGDASEREDATDGDSPPEPGEEKQDPPAVSRETAPVQQPPEDDPTLPLEQAPGAPERPAEMPEPEQGASTTPAGENGREAGAGDRQTGFGEDWRKALGGRPPARPAGDPAPLPGKAAAKANAAGEKPGVKDDDLPY